MKHTILIAEDSYANFLFIKILLHDRFILDWAKDGEEAIRLFMKNTYSLVLLDYHMPVFNGTEVVQMIRLFDQKTPVVAQTGYDIQEQNLRTAGCNDVVIKPIRKEVLFRVVRMYIPDAFQEK